VPTRLDREALVLDRAAYSRSRPAVRERMIALRDLRRVALGDTVSLEFENADTLLYQVQEMLFVEGVAAAADVDHELAAYGRLLPGGHRLTATTFLTFDDVLTVKDELMALSGIQHLVALQIGPEGSVVRVPGVEVRPDLDDDPAPAVDRGTTFSVHFLEFVLDDVARDLFRDPQQPASVVVDHPAYSAQVRIDGPTRLALVADLALR
jgi:hypothetical protein